MDIYVGNLAYDVTDEDLMRAFAAHGTVQSARVMTNRETREQRGFGFVEMTDKTEAERAIEALNGSEFKGRSLTVNEARPRTTGARRRSYP